ncbi:MAG TPA: BMP family ABC transporter substrate-binding protein, partial [Casimicrobiaceae bacterium]|nr:BMP family ABC transporter substrate-binding protein [Casimicrobiaceae bacterium]
MSIAREVQGGSFKGHIITPGVKDDVVLLVLNPEIKSTIPARAIAASDSVGAMIKAGAFHALDDILAGADTAKPIKPNTP